MLLGIANEVELGICSLYRVLLEAVCKEQLFHLGLVGL